MADRLGNLTEADSEATGVTSPPSPKPRITKTLTMTAITTTPAINPTIHVGKRSAAEAAVWRLRAQSALAGQEVPAAA
jgi:hypothetical protein